MERYLDPKEAVLTNHPFYGPLRLVEYREILKKAGI